MSIQNIRPVLGFAVGLLIALLIRGCDTDTAALSSAQPTSFETRHLLGATPIPTPSDAGLSLVSNGSGPAAASWQVPPRNVYTASDVYINASTGSDSNTGTSIGSPWATNAALARAVGVYGMILPPGTGARWFTIHYEGSVPSDLLNLQAVLGPNVSILVTGTDVVTTAHSGTISSAVGYTNSNTLASITDTGVSNWTPYVNQRITWTGGAAVGAKAWIAKDLGSNTARVSGPGLLFDVVATGRSFPQYTAPSTGTYTIDNLGTLYLGLFDIQATNNGNAIEPFVNFNDLNLYDTSSIGADANPTGPTIAYVLNGCSVTWRDFEGITLEANICSFPQGIFPETGSSLAALGCLFNIYMYPGANSTTYVGLWSLGEGTGFVASYGATLNIGDVAVENAVVNFANPYGDGIGIANSFYGTGSVQLVPATGIVGSGNAGVGIRVGRGRTVTSYITPKITGTGGDFALDQDTSDWAWNNATGAYIATPVANTWANLATNLTGGGFGGSAHAPRSNTHLVTPDVN